MNHKTHSFCTLIWQYSWYMWCPKGQLSTCMLQQKPPFLSVLFLVSQRLWINNRSTDGICSMSARRTWAQFCPYRPIMLSYSALFYVTVQCKRDCSFHSDCFSSPLLYQVPPSSKRPIYFAEPYQSRFQRRFHNKGTLWQVNPWDPRWEHCTPNS